MMLTYVNKFNYFNKYKEAPFGAFLILKISNSLENFLNFDN